MTNTHRTKTISVHLLRRKARAEERRIQKVMAEAEMPGRQTALHGIAAVDWNGEYRTYEGYMRGLGLPVWARGVRVESAGRFQHTVVVTEDRGH